MDHAEIRELLPFKALDRLEGDEARAVNEHLDARCDECESELTSFIEALAAMAMVESGEGTSGRIWSRVEERLGSESVKTGFHGLTDRPALRVEDRARRGASRKRVVAIIASAGAAALVAVIVSTEISRSRLSNMMIGSSKQVTALKTRVDNLQHDLGITGEQLVALQRKVSGTTDLTLASLGPASRVVSLEGLPPAPRAAGVVALNAAQNTAILQVSGLPPAPEGKVYEVWWIGQKQGPVRAGLFEPSREGSTIVTVALPPRGEVVLASAITLEPRGGVEKPSGAMYLKGDFPRH